MQTPSFTLNSNFGHASKKDTLRTSKDIVGTAFKNDDAGATAYDGHVFDKNIEDSSENPAVASKTSSSRGDAKVMFFEGPDKKRLKSATYTTCEVGRDDWFLKASDLELDNYSKSATAWNARIVFKGIPILYTPWINFSFINQSKSGVQLQGEYRYLEPNYSGTDNIEYLPNDSISGRNRYYANLKHQQVFGHGWSGGFNLEHVSDDQYFSDLSTHIIVTSQ